MATISAQEFLKGGKPTLIKPASEYLSSVPSQQTGRTFTQKLKSGYNSYSQGVNNIMEGISDPLFEAGKNITNDLNDPNKGFLSKTESVVQNIAGGTVKSIFSPVGQAIEKVGEVGGSLPGMQTVATSKYSVASALLDDVEKGTKFLTEAWNDFETKNPEMANHVKTANNVAQFMTLFASSPAAKELKVPLDKSIQTATDVVQAGKDTLRSGVDAMKIERPTAETIALERKAKIEKGLTEQNTRLKTADKSFNKNTITRKTLDGKSEVITPIDTFSKYNISPNVEKGGIQMGDYRTGVGELGKIKSHVEALDNQIDTKLVNSGEKISVEQLKQSAIDNALKNEDFRQSGTVSANVKKIESRFDDYKTSYGETIDIAELNNIRKTANKDWNIDTQDVSRIVGDTAREIIHGISKGEVKALLQKQGELLAARKYAEVLNGTKVTGGRLGNMALRTTGAIIGATVPKMPIIGPIIGAIGGEFAARALQQSQFKSLWTELRALIQSKSKEQTTSAITTPKSATNIPSTISRDNFKKKFNTKLEKDLPALRKEIKTQKPIFTKINERLAKDSGGNFIQREKTDKSIMRKQARGAYKNRTFGTTGDLLGSTIVMDSSKIDGAIANAKKLYNAEVDDFRKSESPLGYKAVHLDVQMPNGMKTEIQLNTKEGLKQKAFSHDIYDKWRDYIESAQGSSITDILKKIPESKYSEFLEDVQLSKDIYSGKVRVPLTPEMAKKYPYVKGLSLEFYSKVL